MLDTTQDAVKALLKTDPTLTPTDRQRITGMLRTGAAPEPKPAEHIDEIIRRTETARRLGVGVRAVDAWARAGILHKVRLPGRTRAAGFRAGDIAALINGRGAK